MRMLAGMTLLLPVLLACTGCSDSDTEEVERDVLDGVGDVQLVSNQFSFAAGATWRPSAKDLLVSDTDDSTIYRVELPATVEVFRQDQRVANGLALDVDKTLLAAERGTRLISRTRSDGSIESVADSYQGKKLNDPNDIAVARDGTIYFTDPAFVTKKADLELGYNAVFRVAPGKAPTVEYEGALPNGIALSPDDKVLYVADTAAGVISFPIKSDGSLESPVTLNQDIPLVDGMAVDSKGNLFVSSLNGVVVLRPDGEIVGTIEVPSAPTNCAFGDSDGKTLFIPARSALYSLRLVFPGR